MTKQQRRQQPQPQPQPPQPLDTPENLPPPPPQYVPRPDTAQEAPPPPYSQQGPPLPARRESHPPSTPPRRESGTTAGVPPSTDVNGARQPSVSLDVTPTAPSTSNAMPQTKAATSHNAFLAGLAKLNLTPRRPDSTSTLPLTKPLPRLPTEPPPVPPSSGRQAGSARPVSYAGAPSVGQTPPHPVASCANGTQTSTNGQRANGAQPSPYVPPPVPPRPSGQPHFAPPQIAVHANLGAAGGPASSRAGAPFQVANGHRNSWSIGEPVVHGRAPNPSAAQPPLPRPNQPTTQTQSEPGGRRKPYPAVAAFPGPPPPRHPLATGSKSSTLPTLLDSPPPRHPIAAAKSNSSLPRSSSALPIASSPAQPVVAAPKPEPKQQATPQAPSKLPINSSLYAAAGKRQSTGAPKSSTSDAGVIDLTGIDDSPPRGARSDVSTPRRQRVASQNQPLTPPPAQASASASSSPSGSARCAGFTRAGTPCKRQVKATAAYLLSRDMNADDDDAPRAVGRYCRSHAGLVCAADGFYWRDSKGQAGVWVKFDDFIPPDLGEQTRTLLRMTMESPVSQKEGPGHLYAYELRSLSSPRTTFIKVGRSDNVPRRMGQWSNQCTSHTPTLRDVFPLKSLNRQPSRLGSLLPGATKSSDVGRMVPYVKRWERLVHLELAERAAAARQAEYSKLLAKCGDCGAVHKEIFPLAEPKAYDGVVQAVERWERFVRLIAA